MEETIVVSAAYMAIFLNKLQIKKSRRKKRRRERLEAALLVKTRKLQAARKVVDFVLGSSSIPPLCIELSC